MKITTTVFCLALLAAAGCKKKYGAGFTKDRCNQQACYYTKGEQRIGVQPIDFRVGKKRLVTVVLTAR